MREKVVSSQPDLDVCHEVQWTKASTDRFWNFLSRSSTVHEDYFSKRFASTLVKLVKRMVGIQAPVMDLGCGPGYLIRELSRSGVRCYGMDNSLAVPHNVDIHHRCMIVGTLDAIPVESSSVRTAFLIEVLEHLPDDKIMHALNEAHRILVEGGTIVITVPNEERLEDRKVMCPECGCIFHRVQHVQSFDTGRIRELLIRFGFEPMQVKSLDLTLYGRKGILGVARRLAAPWVDRGRTLPHMLAIAQKIDSGREVRRMAGATRGGERRLGGASPGDTKARVRDPASGG